MTLWILIQSIKIINFLTSDESPIWKNVTESEKKALKYANKPDGEFWYIFTYIFFLNYIYNIF